MQARDLPINAVLAEIDAALAAAAAPPRKPLPPRAVLIAPPGAGKSTYLPLHLLGAPWAQKGRIILLEPRRLAARAVARRMALLRGEAVGQTVGYAMRMDKNYSAKTRILVMTEGSFTRLILDNPELPGISAVLFDEFHERSLEADFGLALALDAADSLRPDLRLLVMSATLDGARVADLLAQNGGKAPIITCSGRNFPVEIRYRPRGAAGRGGALRRESAEEAVAKACCALLAAEPAGGILAFLPGQAEIKRAQALLEERLPAAAAASLIIAPLYGGLPAAAQEAALRPAPPGFRKIVLATSIAESALTIEDVRIVIDSGLARLPVFDSGAGMTRLQTVRASRAAAAQRAGRAGRLGPGLAVRLWHEGQNSALPEFTPPEILAADMSNLLLDCADFGVSDPQNLRFLDTPPAAAAAEARQNLAALGALALPGGLTPFGRALRQLSLPLPYAHMLLAAARQGKKPVLAAAGLAVLLTEQGLGGTSDDLDKRLENFARDHSPRAAKARALAKMLAAKAEKLAASLPQPAEAQSQGETAITAGTLLAAAWWRRLARRRENEAPANGESAAYLLANGSGAALGKDSPLSGKTWLICAELAGGKTRARIKAAAEIDEFWLKTHLADKITEESRIFFDAENRALRAARQRRLGAIALETAPMPPPKGEAANQGWLQAVAEHGLDILPWSKAALSLRARLAFLRAVLGAPWPDAGDKALAETAAAWLLPFLPGQARFAAAEGDFLCRALAALPGHAAERQLNRLAPAHFTVPSGAQIAIRYQDGAAVLPVRVQEVFGMRRQPLLAGGKAPLLLELLSPAGRVLQITADIAGFWAGSWRDVAADMRGRYPKHFWPQNPETAAPTAKTKNAYAKSGGG